MNLDGDLSRIRLPKVLLGIGAQKGTGILTVQGADDIVAVSFVGGAVVTADALNQTVEDGLGRVLQAKGWLSGDEFEAALGEYQGGSSGSLGEHLIERAMIDRGQLLEALREQTLDSMMGLLGWKSGEFKFYSGDEVSYEDGLMPITVEELLVVALDRLGEKVGLVGTVPSAASIYRQVPPRGEVQVFGRDGDGMSAGIWITEHQEAFLQRVDGRRSASEITRELGYSRYQTQFTLYYLTQYDLLEATGRRGKAAPRAPAGPRPVGPPGPATPAAAPVGPSPEPAAPSPPSPGPAPGGLEEPTDPSGLAYFGEESAADLISPLDESGMFDAEMSAIPPSADLKAEIFRPPDDLDESRSARRATRATANALLDAAAIGMAALLALSIVLVMMQRPVSLLLPFPWQDNARATAERQVREAQFKRIDRAARTYFLLEAHYPDSLEVLVESGLLTAEDLKDPAGHVLSYSTDGISYQILLQEDGQNIEGLGTTEGITGDFFVDPQFLSSAASADAPLVLLD